MDKVFFFTQANRWITDSQGDFMAIAFAQVSIHSRSKGHSAVAASGYRTASRLTDERTGIVYDFTNRKNVAYTETLLPENADPRYFDRHLLWNSVEACESRKDAQICKDIVLALPKELDLANQIELAKRFAQTYFVNEGIPADIAIHMDEGNPHAHILITTRRLEQSGFSKHKARDLNPAFYSGKVVEQDYWGEQWRDFQNDYFKEQDLDCLVDFNHLIPERHEGAFKNNPSSYVKEENALIREERIDLALNNIENLINQVSLVHSVFTRRDIEKLLFKTLDTPQSSGHYLATVEQMINHRDVISLGPNDAGIEAYTTRHQYIAEAKLLKAIELMQGRNGHVFHLNTALINHQYTLNEEQQLALNYITEGRDISVLIGRPGTGKSYLLKPIKEHYEAYGMRVIGAALSGKVAKSLQQDTGINSSTIASLTYRINTKRLALTKDDVVIIDEAGMVDFASISTLIDAANKAKAKVVLVGDPDQLKPIHQGEIFRGIAARTGFIELGQIRRQKDLGDRQASLNLSKGNIAEAVNHYQQKGAIHFADYVQDATSNLIHHWQHSITTAADIKENAIFSFSRAAVHALNQEAREVLKQKNILGSHDIVWEKHVDNSNNPLDCEQPEIRLTKQERILFRKNDKALGVRNGDMAFVESITQHQIQARLDSGEKVTIPRTYKHIDYGYATTVHKGQGMTVDNAHVLIDSKYWDKNLSFVAMTRHREQLSIYADKHKHFDVDALIKTLSRASTRDNVIDWPLDFAIRAGFDPDKMVGRALNKIVGTKQKIKNSWNYLVDYEAYLKAENIEARIAERQELRLAAKEAATHLDQKSAKSTDKIHEAPLEAVLSRYVGLELEQSRLVSAMHSAKIQGLKESRDYSTQTIAHSKQIKAFAVEAMKHPEIKALLETMKKLKPASLVERGGFSAIRERVAQSGWFKEDRDAVLINLRGRANDQSRSQTQEQERGGRSR